MVSILYTFNVGKAKGPDGVEVEIDPDAVSSSVIRQAQDLLYRHICSNVRLYSAPEPFICSVVPRFARAESLIRDAVHPLHSYA